MTGPDPSERVADSSERADQLRALLGEERLARLQDVLAGRTRDLTVVLENLYDSHNLSAVLRTADAFGVQEVHVIDREGDFAITRKITRGAHKWLDIVVHTGDSGTADCVRLLRGRGYRLLAATLAEDAVPLGELDLSGRVALVFGNEHEGITEGMARACDSAYVIPMRGFVQSFNVSVSAAITLQHARAARAWPTLDEADAASVLELWMGRSLKQTERVLRALDGTPDAPGKAT